jgi:hypothetical protein
MKNFVITLKMFDVEAKRLANMCDHIGEEAHDGNNEEPWFAELWWNDLADNIRDQLRNQGVKEEEIFS